MVDDIEEVQHLDGPEELSPIRFDALETIARDVMAFKDNLRRLVDEKGSITRLNKPGWLNPRSLDSSAPPPCHVAQPSSKSGTLSASLMSPRLSSGFELSGLTTPS